MGSLTLSMPTTPSKQQTCGTCTARNSYNVPSMTKITYFDKQTLNSSRGSRVQHYQPWSPHAFYCSLPPFEYCYLLLHFYRFLKHYSCLHQHDFGKFIVYIILLVVGLLVLKLIRRNRASQICEADGDIILLSCFPTCRMCKTCQSVFQQNIVLLVIVAINWALFS
jgi:hypothetical protein